MLEPIIVSLIFEEFICHHCLTCIWFCLLSYKSMPFNTFSTLICLTRSVAGCEFSCRVRCLGGDLVCGSRGWGWGCGHGCSDRSPCGLDRKCGHQECPRCGWLGCGCRKIVRVIQRKYPHRCQLQVLQQTKYTRTI